MMYSKNYLEESGIDLEQLTSNLELIADQLFFIARAPQDRPMPVRTPRPSTALWPSRSGRIAVWEEKHR